MSDRLISDSVRALAGSKFSDELYWLACNVDSVDEDSRTCSVTTISGDATMEIPDVRLQAEISDGILIIPSVNSTVFVGYTKRNEPYVQLFSEIDRVVWVTGNTSLEMSKDGIKLNDGAYGGLIKIDDLVKKLNDLENALNDLIGKFNSHTHTGVTTGTGVSGPTATQETTTLTTTQKSDLENTLITHGK